MSTFSAMVLKHRQKKDGTYHVYIRVTHKTKVAYIATEYHVTSAKLNKYKEIIDSNIINACRKIIAGYENEILRLGSLIDSFTVSELVEHLTKYKEEIIDFFKVADEYIGKNAQSDQSAPI